MRIHFDVGVGDFFMADSFWSPDRKASLEVVHHAFIDSPADRALIAIMDACPAYRHVRHVPTRYPTEPIAGTIPTLRDHSISPRLSYHGSAFLGVPLDCEVPEGLPDRFDYIQPSTPKNGPRCDRFIHGPEWPGVFARLEERGTVGLVINSPGGPPVPDHPRLIDWTGRTTLPQAVEILKRASGYLGIDSCMAILAAQLFPAGDLIVRTTNPYMAENPWLYYPPLEDFSFLVPVIGAAPYRQPTDRPAGGEVVELRCNALVGFRNFTRGDRVEVSPERARQMVASGQAIPITTED